MPRHRARLDFSREPIAHHYFIAFAPFVHKPWHFAKVVTIIGIAHHDKCAARRANSGFQRRAVASIQKPTPKPEPTDELTEALINLGYKRAEIDAIVDEAKNSAESVEGQLRHALRSLQR